MNDLVSFILSFGMLFLSSSALSARYSYEVSAEHPIWVAQPGTEDYRKMARSSCFEIKMH